MKKTIIGLLIVLIVGVGITMYEVRNINSVAAACSQAALLAQTASSQAKTTH